MLRINRSKSQFFRVVAAFASGLQVSVTWLSPSIGFAGPGLFELVSKGKPWTDQENAEKAYKKRLDKIRKNKNFEGSLVWQNLFGSEKLEYLPNRSLKVLEVLGGLAEFEAGAVWAKSQLKIEDRYLLTEPETVDQFFRYLGIFHEIHNQIGYDLPGNFPTQKALDQIYQGLSSEAKKALQARNAPRSVIESVQPKPSQEVHPLCASSFSDDSGVAEKCSKVLRQATDQVIFWKPDLDDLVHHALKHPLQNTELKRRFSDLDLESWVQFYSPLIYEGGARDLLFEVAQSASNQVRLGFEPTKAEQGPETGTFSFCLAFTAAVKKPNQKIQAVQRFKKALVYVSEENGELSSHIATFIPRMDDCDLPKKKKPTPLRSNQWSNYLNVLRSQRSNSTPLSP